MQTELTIQECEFLIVVTRMALTPRRASSWDEYLGDSQVTCKVLLSRGVMAEASTAEKVAAGFRVQDLKALLRERGLKVSGRKEELVSRLMEAMTGQEASDAAKSVTFFKLTPDGQQVVDAHLEEKASEKRKAEERALAYLRSGNYENAESEIVIFTDAYNRLFWQKKGGGRDADGILSATGPENHVYYLLNMPVEELALGDNERRKVAEALAIGRLVCDELEDVTQRVLEVTGGSFPCPSIEDFLSSDPCGGYARRFQADDPADVAAIYTHTKFFEASNTSELRWMMEAPWVSTIVVLVPKKEKTHKDYYVYCPCCEEGPTEFDKRNPEAIPHLPRHWGCRCLYLFRE